MEKRILSILVDNTSGVLSRVAGLFSRRGYNIDSITAGVTADQRYSRMTVVCEGDDQMLQQIPNSWRSRKMYGMLRSLNRTTALPVS